MTLCTEVGLSPHDTVLHGDPAPPPSEKGHMSIEANVYCGQTAVCVRIPLGTEVGLSLGDIVLEGNPAPPPLKGHSPSNFRLMSVVAKRLHGLDATWYGGRPRLRRLCV